MPKKRTLEQRLKAAFKSAAGSCTLLRYYGKGFGKKLSGVNLQNPKKRTSRTKQKHHRQKK